MDIAPGKADIFQIEAFDIKQQGNESFSCLNRTIRRTPAATTDSQIRTRKKQRISTRVKGSGERGRTTVERH